MKQRHSNRGSILDERSKGAFTFLLIIIAVIGLGWGALKQVNSGVLYLTFTVVIVVLLVITSIFIPETDRKQMREYFTSPISSYALVQMATWLLGIFIILILSIPVIANSFSVAPSEYFSSLYFTAAGLEDNLAESFEAAQIQTSLVGYWFYTAWVAGNIEELGFGLVLPLVFNNLSIMLVNQLLNGKAPFGMNNSLFHFLFSMILTAAAFMYIHRVNGDYDTMQAFITAGVFRVLMFFSVFWLGLTLAFDIGVHMASNTIVLIRIVGIERFFYEVIATPWGLLFFGVFIFALISVALNPKKTWNLLVKDYQNPNFNRPFGRNV